MIEWQVNILETAPSELAKSMVIGYVNMRDVAESLNSIFMCVNATMLDRKIGGDPDLPPPEDDIPSMWTEVMTDDELKDTREWLIMLASYE
jgi:hypothetical protein